MTFIGNYELTKALKLGGQSRWGFVRKDGHEYFIKEFLAPKYPVVTKDLTPDLIQIQRTAAERFEDNQSAFYQALKRCRNGCMIVNLDFFRDGPYYYAVTDKVKGPYLSVEEIAALPEEKKRALTRSVLAGIAELHSRHIVHSDIKPDNILVIRTRKGFCAAKIIDFESGYFEGRQPRSIVGDPPYFSPEKIYHETDEETDVLVSSDIFALGVLFHQYWTGSFPLFDTQQYSSVGDALLQGGSVALSTGLPEDIFEMIRTMLNLDPDERPTAEALLEAQLLPLESLPAPIDVSGETGAWLENKQPIEVPPGFRPMGDDDL
nr:protein kinase [Lachnospiraceae bacterium]